jgi:N-hydroxyarylamine O-acetyltransferase
MTLDPITVERYLARLGVERPSRPDLRALRTLQERHVRSIPFENVDCFRRRPLPLGSGAVDKIVHEHRGGGCYELNSAMSLLLKALGFQVTILGGKIYEGGKLTFPLRHLILRVETPEGRWLVDAGFGFGANRNSIHPLDLGSREAQADPHGEYRLLTTPDGDIDVLRDGRPLYRVEMHPREIEDFSATLWWFLTSPDSDFLQGMFCILPHESGRISLRDQTLSEVADGRKTVTELAGESEVREVLAGRFGIVVDAIPDLMVPGREIAPRMAEKAGLAGAGVAAAAA